jgi:hypothetical protein
LPPSRDAFLAQRGSCFDSLAKQYIPSKSFARIEALHQQIGEGKGRRQCLVMYVMKEP